MKVQLQIAHVFGMELNSHDWCLNLENIGRVNGLWQGLANSFRKGPDSIYFRLHGLHGLRCNYSTLLLERGRSRR